MSPRNEYVIEIHTFSYTEKSLVHNMHIAYAYAYNMHENYKQHILMLCNILTIQ